MENWARVVVGILAVSCMADTGPAAAPDSKEHHLLARLRILSEQKWRQKTALELRRQALESREQALEARNATVENRTAQWEREIDASLRERESHLERLHESRLRQLEERERQLEERAAALEERDRSLSARFKNWERSVVSRKAYLLYVSRELERELETLDATNAELQDARTSLHSS